MKSASSVHIALLRGVNVGGKNRLPMKDLATIFAAAGCEDVRTWIQSGNVVLRARAAIAKTLAASVEAGILAHAGLRVPVVVRSAAEWKNLVRENPMLKRGIDPDFLHVGFLPRVPHSAAVAALDPKRSPGDEFVVKGREIYFHLPNGMGRSRLTNAWFDSALSTTVTVRNWRTVLALLEMSGEA